MSGLNQAVDSNTKSILCAEIIAIGDELVSGVRLDTNSQWIAQQLDRLGIRTINHVTVGDDGKGVQQVFAVAVGRADLVITTGGLGPTADDLTRYAIAEMADVELEVNQAVLDRIRQMYQRRGREMPVNNEVQALFPTGATVIDNPEGTAPGIEFAATVADSASRYRIMAFPGVPAELKQMWHRSAEKRIRQLYSISATTVHHTVHCFGAGESAIEMQLPELMVRGRDPLVGITASAATVSLRIATRAKDEAACQEKIKPTLDTIRERLGDLIFGENGQQLEDVVVNQLIANRQTIAIFDWGFFGEVARKLAVADCQGACVETSRAFAGRPYNDQRSVQQTLEQICGDATWHENASLVLVIGPVDRDEQHIQEGDAFFEIAVARQLESGWQPSNQRFRFSGHSAWRETRAVKDVLNAIRLL